MAITNKQQMQVWTAAERWAAKQLDEMMNITFRALKEIHKDCGRVCSNYDTCTHQACNSSHQAWEIADKALKDIMYAGSYSR